MSTPPDRTRQLDFVWFVRGGTLRLGDRAPLRVGTESVLIGRDPSCALAVPDPRVSATHCELRAEPQGVLVSDLGSTNGTFVNGIRVKQVHLLAPATIEVGETRIQFEPTEREAVELEPESTFGPLVGASAKMRHVFRLLREVAATDLSILITGETGTGKELVAQAVHEASARAKAPFVVVDCTSIPQSLAESILFGHERGAFTGATERRDGAFQEANGGTVFLDELADLPGELQPKLLRVLADKKVKRVGSQQVTQVDVRVVAAARFDLARSMNEGRFRNDLFFRLAQVRVELPPLRERREDIPLIVRHACERSGKPERAEDLVQLIEWRFGSYDWPGNVRELVNVTSVAASLPPGAEAVANMLPLEKGAEASVPPMSAFAESKRQVMNSFEQRYFTELHRVTTGNVSEMARRSGLARHQVRGYLRKYGLRE